MELDPRWIDGRIYRILARPEMWFQGAEALVHVVYELLIVRAKLTGREVDWITYANWERLGMKKGNHYITPDVDGRLVKTLTEIALEAGYSPGEWPDRDAAWRDHVRTCPSCSTHYRHLQEACEEGVRLSSLIAGIDL